MIRPSGFPLWKIPPFLFPFVHSHFPLIGTLSLCPSMDDMVLFFLFIYFSCFVFGFFLFSLTLSGHSLHGKVGHFS
ncbi:hypothetical protein P168DRAFT_4756 [Aspergillus campestris IBT 28561]|uniref:Uncharacterized protein n=1 Tax=Aspergillus campestris (strain IBT 28561) TaxID=1392248 RepID=A0A2I1DDJ8_ASPC2|nr:uncharacterized protein P168DRAFT_4756 [Aspergillus campestris IBT 28561]PKY07935.1 hypothetical protein P168DRAFT_4756 [Aspergillus campestris IBT 28561]